MTGLAVAWQTAPAGNRWRVSSLRSKGRAPPACTWTHADLGCLLRQPAGDLLEPDDLLDIIREFDQGGDVFEDIQNG